MKFRVCRADDLEYLTVSGMEGAVHCFTTRRGGVSQGCFASLNLGIHRGDDPQRVLENYRRLGNALGFAPEDTVLTHQTHTAIVRAVGWDARGEGLFRPVPGDYDALITNTPGVALTVFTADCTPILLYDPIAGAVGAVHAGWRGTAAGIVKEAVRAMTIQYGSKPQNIRAAIGPCIGGCCFETGEEVPHAMVQALGTAANACIRPAEEKYYVDLKGLNRLWLSACGVQAIAVSDDCTKCQGERFWSHRITGNARGSQAAIIMLRKESN